MFGWHRPKAVECPPRPERRSWERIPTLIRVLWQKNQGKDELSWSAHVVDISRGGLQVLSPHKFDLTTVISVEKEDEQESTQFLVALGVRAQPAPKGGWRVGVART